MVELTEGICSGDQVEDENFGQRDIQKVTTGQWADFSEGRSKFEDEHSKVEMSEHCAIGHMEFGHPANPRKSNRCFKKNDPIL
jgi:hypothetical protein